MSIQVTIILLVAAQRLAELIYARRNTRRLLAQGAKEYGAAHYPAIVLLHAAWLLSLVFIEPQSAVNHWLIALFIGLQAARVWVLLTLGPHWTTRVIVLPDAPLVRTGAYRFCNHPNYVIVAAEIAVLPLAFGLWQIALIFSVLNAAILSYRIHIENAALAGI